MQPVQRNSSHGAEILATPLGKAMNRRAFLSGSGKAVLTLGLASAGGRLMSSLHSADVLASAKAAGTRSVKLQQSYLNNVEFAGYYVAAKMGIYKKYGLTVDILTAGTTTDPRAIVADGGAQIGIVSETSDTLIGIAEGVPYKCIGAAFQTNPGCLLVLASSKIYNIKDLEGKVVGIQDDARQQVLGILKAHNVPASKVGLLVVGTDPGSLVEGKVDAYTAYVFNEPIALKMKGVATRCYSFSKIGLPGYGDNVIATNHTIDSTGEMLARFMRASQEGWKYAVAHPSDAVSITLKDFPSDQTPTQQKLQMQAEIPMLTSSTTKAHGLLAISKSVWSQAIAAAKVSGALAKPVTVAESLTQEILKRAAHVKPA